MYTEILQKLEVLLVLQQKILASLLVVEKQAIPIVTDEWLDNTDVKRLLKISDSSLYRLRKQQLLPCKRIAGKWYYSRLALATIISG
jgi:hypothetical protein